MVCGTTCVISIVFIIANLYVSLNIKDSKKYNFYKMLNNVEIEKYEKIINERRKIYLEGYVFGLILSFIIIVLNKKYNFLGKNSVICLIGAITLTFNYFYYILSPKTDYMVLHLDKKEQRIQLHKMNRYMQIKYHIGLVIGIFSAMIFTKSLL